MQEIPRRRCHAGDTTTELPRNRIAQRTHHESEEYQIRTQMMHHAEETMQERLNGCEHIGTMQEKPCRRDSPDMNTLGAPCRRSAPRLHHAEVSSTDHTDALFDCCRAGDEIVNG